MLKQGKLEIFYANYDNINESTWIAAMAMLIKKPGQSLFVTRNPVNLPSPDNLSSWIFWPTLYGLPLTDAEFQQVGGGEPTVVGNHWYFKRTFQNGEITACHFGIKKDVESFDLTRLVPVLAHEQYEPILHPLFGTWNKLENNYKADRTNGCDKENTCPNTICRVDYFALGTQGDSSGFYKKLITVSVAVWRV